MPVAIAVRPCEGCGCSHIGPRCPAGTSWLSRLRSVRLDPRATPSSTKRNYFDSGAVTEVFGADSEERMYDETDGLGPAYRDRRGEFWRKDRRTGEHVPASEADLDFLTGSGTED